MHYVVTGANRGIGLELTRQLLQRGDTVVATVRDPARADALLTLERQHPGKLTVLDCDVGDDASVKAFAARVRGPVDVLINNAGVAGEPGASLERLSFEDALRTFNVNALGPLRVTRALLPRLREGTTKKVLHLTSGMSSIGDNHSGGAYGYRMSKAALNMASRNLAVDFRSEGLLSAVINPGWVQTDMGGRNAPTSVATSARGILAQLDALTTESSGTFLDHAGKRWSW